MSDALEKIEQIEADIAQLREMLPENQPESKLFGEMVTEALLSEITGYTRDQLESKRRRGKVTESYHYYVDPDGRITWHLERFYAWVRGEKPPASKDVVTHLESISDGRLVANKRSSRKSPTRRLPRA